MAYKQFTLDDNTEIVVYKRSGSRSLRLSVTNTGVVRVTIPPWSPYQVGLQFARSRLDWIRQHQTPVLLLQPGQAVGKAHHLRFSPQASAQRITSRVLAGEILIGYPAQLDHSDGAVQKVARTACIRGLRRQAEQLLPQRLASLAKTHDYTYSSVAIKQLKGRWGSCDQSQNIIFNLFLMQLPWECIDYVIRHELVHTRVLHHGPDFWADFEHILPDAKAIRKLMRQYQPNVYGVTAKNDGNAL